MSGRPAPRRSRGRATVTEGWRRQPECRPCLTAVFASLLRVQTRVAHHNTVALLLRCRGGRVGAGAAPTMPSWWLHTSTLLCSKTLPNPEFYLTARRSDAVQPRASFWRKKCLGYVIAPHKTEAGQSCAATLDFIPTSTAAKALCLIAGSRQRLGL